MKALFSAWKSTLSGRVIAGLCIVSLALLFTRSLWRWESALALSWASASLVIMGPIGASLAAFDTWRLCPRDTQTLQTNLPRRLSVGLQIVACSAMSMTVAWLVTTVVAMGIAFVGGSTFTGDVWQVPMSLIVIMTYSAFGALMGHMIPSLAAAPVAGLIGYLLPNFLPAIGNENLFQAGGGVSLLSGLYRPVEWPLAVCVVNAVAAVAMLTLLGEQILARLTRVFLAVVLVAVLIVPAFLRFDEPARSDPDTTLVCAGGKPQVCVIRGHEGYLPALAWSIQHGASRLEAKGLTTRSRFVEAVIDEPTAEPTTTNFYPTAPTSWQARYDNDAIAEILGYPSVCPDTAPNVMLRSQVTDRIRAVLDGEQLTKDQVAVLRDGYHRLNSC